MRDDDVWFITKPGFGLVPITWQGWTLLTLHLAAIYTGRIVLGSLDAAFLWVLGTVLLLLPLYAVKNRDGWRGVFGKHRN